MTPAGRRIVPSGPRTPPTEGGYVMPAEWEPHRATWIAWPHNRSDWPGKVEAVRWCYVEIVRRLAAVEPVEMVFGGDAGAERRALRRLIRAGVDPQRVRVHRFPTDRSWVRDSGGTFVRRGAAREARADVALVDWRFNGWAKYDDWAHDNRLPGRIAAAKRMRRVLPRAGRRRPMVLEGGSIDVNGAGAALATEECLLDPVVQPRNPGMDRQDVERALEAWLGVHAVIWLGRGIAGDDTHGHVDDVARFVGPTTVVAATEPAAADENHAPLADNLRRLRAARVGGRPLTVVPLPMPGPLRFGGQRLPASYLNFYVANGVVLVPTFNDPADRVALCRLAELFPDREVVGIHAVDLVLGLGTLHCLTLQEPVA